MTYDFAIQLWKANKAERDLDAVFASAHQVVKASYADQTRGIDRYMTHRTTGNRVSVEYKMDFIAHRTGNAFIETVSVSSTGKPGWLFSCRADWLIYAIVADRRAYVFTPGELQAHYQTHWRSWPVRSSKNSGYWTRGILVPLQDLRPLSHAVFIY